MKRILFVGLLLIVTINSYAQTSSKECLYHIKFYNWQWDYYKVVGYDTIPKYSQYTGEHIGDTILWDTSFKAFSHSDLTLAFPFPASLTSLSKSLSVTSCDDLKKYDVVKFNFSFLGNGNPEFPCTLPRINYLNIRGSSCSKNNFKKLQELIDCDKSIGGLFLDIKLKDISDELETFRSGIKLKRQ